ncbi:MAG: hypothetical protein WDM90_17325 [Ferruginibacter sp.]
MMKEKWGESLGATFSLGLIQFVALIIIIIPCALLAVYVNPVLGIALGVLLVFIVMTIISAAQTIFVSLVYQNINGNINDHFDQQLIDGLFQKK